MKVRDRIKTARKEGFKRVWLMNQNYTILAAEFWLNNEDEWKNGGVGPYVVDEYENEDVANELVNPFQKDTLMMLVEYKKQLHDRARSRCLKDSNEQRKSAIRKKGPHDDFENYLCERNDFVDNTVYKLILDLLGKNENELEWDMGVIGDVTDAISTALETHGMHFCHPYHEGDNETPCYKGYDCPINCKFKEGEI